MDYRKKLILAPMAGVTDLPFRLICKDFGADLVVSEMISAKGIEYKDKKTKLLLATHEAESPLIVQLFGSDPDIMARSAEFVQNEGGKAIDLNLGCPTPKITKNGDGAALGRNEELAHAVISAVVRGASVPVSVKFRSGWDEGSKNCIRLAKIAEQAGASALSIHGRTAQQFYAGHADWSDIQAVKKAVSIPVIGNGDVVSPETAKAMLEETGCDSIMIGRGAQGNPFLFRQIRHFFETGTYAPISPQEKKETILRHLELLVTHKGEHLGMLEARKHIAWYLKGMPHSAAFKIKAFSASTFKEMKAIVSDAFIM